jgi:hypothetical protein
VKASEENTALKLRAGGGGGKLICPKRQVDTKLLLYLRNEAGSSSETWVGKYVISYHIVF